MQTSTGLKCGSCHTQNSVEMNLTIFVFFVPELEVVFTLSQCCQLEAREGEFDV